MKVHPKLLNSFKGSIWYGMHFYPGVAEYQTDGGESYRVFLNEQTIREMDPTFAGCPIFVEHVEEVGDNPQQVKEAADGWVLESFYNAADGKHWVKFIVVTESGERAIKNGMRLSNAYMPKSFGSGGLWNGVEYSKEITAGDYEHLAIVRNPRYEESVIMTPEQFKKYNEDHIVELKRLANSKGEKEMKLSFFKKTKVENAIDPEMMTTLPKSGKEISIVQLVNDADEMEMHKKNDDVMADMSHKVKLHDGSMCNVGELLEKHKAMHDEMEKMKKDDAMEPESDVAVEKKSVEVKGDNKAVDNDEAMDKDEEAKKKAMELAAHEEEEIEKKKNALKEEEEKNKAAAKEKADRLRNAGPKAEDFSTITPVAMSGDLVARGKARYGSN